MWPQTRYYINFLSSKNIPYHDDTHICARESKKGYYSSHHENILLFKKKVLLPWFFLFTRGFITVVQLSEIIQIWRIALLKTNIAWLFVIMIGVFASILSIPPYIEICFIALFLFYWDHNFPKLLSDMIENVTFIVNFINFNQMVTSLSDIYAVLAIFMPVTGKKKGIT